ncbi:MAG: hypothetical protein KatS3mg019_1602 [Fimbriimonadales bacterium]|nr:MAG: hypothetical protein KatS3mg019_1602 [Fimbriimonadales bacterium]
MLLGIVYGRAWYSANSAISDISMWLSTTKIQRHIGQRVDGMKPIARWIWRITK